VISLFSAIFAPETAHSPLRGEGVKVEESALAPTAKVAQLVE
jgi:hypothetical protein